MISCVKFHCNRFTTAQDIQDYESHFMAQCIYTVNKYAVALPSINIITL